MSPLHVILSLLLFSSVFGDRVILEPESRIPRGWRAIKKTSPETELELIIALKQQNMDFIEKNLLQISDPKNARYGQYLTRTELDQTTLPSTETSTRVKDWLQSNLKNGEKFEEKGAYIIAYVSTSTAESMLGCQFHNFFHLSGNSVARCSTPYTIPSEIAPHIDLIGGVSHFPKIHKRPLKPSNDERQPGLGVTPRLIRERYQVSGSGSQSTNLQAVAQFLDQFYSELDLQEFFALLFQESLGQVPTVVGNNTWYEPGTEASLDIEYIMSVGYRVPTWFYSTLGTHANQEPFLRWTVEVYQEKKIPYVISISYGDDEDSLTSTYMNRVNDEFKKLGNLGTSLLFASGDSGVGCNEGSNNFVPNFPASSPWVTAVGGTTTIGWFETGDEIVNYISGGGFSNVFSMPDYQQSAVKTYFQRAQGNLPNSTLYNSTGRAYPDVAALSAGFTIVVNLVPLPGVAGTSCAAPTFSGVVALLNDFLIGKSSPVLGFLNPWLYSTAVESPEGFFDVTNGCNFGDCPTNGFCATKGWDPATGIGSPKYDALVQILTKQRNLK